jgi:Fe-S-cluster containining protein
MTDNEANRIAANIHQPTKDFSTQTGEEPYSHEMKKIGGRCNFLDCNNQCQIYQFRPIICRFYPFELKFDVLSNMHVFGYTAECPQVGYGIKITKKHYAALFGLAQQTLP